MKDYADKKWLSEPLQDQRLAPAIAYLKERNLWRGSVSCEHVYTDSEVFMNAIEAIQGQGQVSVRSYKNEDNQGVVVEIEDSGMGILQDHLEIIFEPFFSTKPKGTGLGLAVNYGIIQKHGGQIRVRQPARPWNHHDDQAAL